MVSKCVNPACEVKFTYFGTGELLVKTCPETGDQELFWLCQRCATEWQIPAEMISFKATKSRLGKRTAFA